MTLPVFRPIGITSPPAHFGSFTFSVPTIHCDPPEALDSDREPKAIQILDTFVSHLKTQGYKVTGSPSNNRVKVMGTANQETLLGQWLFNSEATNFNDGSYAAHLDKAPGFIKAVNACEEISVSWAHFDVLK